MSDVHDLLGSSSLAVSTDDKEVRAEIEDNVIRYIAMEAMSGKQNPFTFLTHAHFTDPLLREIYRIIMQHYDAGARFSVGSLLNDTKFKDNPDVLNYLKSLVSCHDLHGHITAESMAFDIDEHYRQAEIRSLVKQLLEDVDNSSFYEAKNKYDVCNDKVSRLFYSPLTTQSTFTHDEALDYFLNDYLKNDEKKISTGLKSLDKYLGGFVRGNLIVIGGRPSMGKTAFLIHLIVSAAKQGFHTLNFSLEMTNGQTISRFVSLNHFEDGHFDLNYTDLTKKSVENEVVQNAVAKSKALKCNIYHNYDSTLTVDDICTQAEMKAKELLRHGKALDMVCVDYLQIIAKDNMRRSENDALGDITGKLKRLAKKLNVVVILLSQLNREVEKEKNIQHKRPNMSHLRQSGSIEQDADIVLFPFRPSQYEKDVDFNFRKYRFDYMEIIVAKNRQGETGTTKANCDMAHNCIYDTSEDDDGLTAHGRDNAESKKEPPKMSIK
ncbi:MAG: DnaB-like helicase C-terminal domain-containing protein [Pseudomonadota bacterium]